MLNDLLTTLKNEFEIKENDTGKYKKMKVGPMTFLIRSFDIKGVGRMSLMEGKAMMGLMKMDTLIINPLSCDAPLFSYDRIKAMGNDTLYLELYNTQVNEISLDELAKVKEKYANLPDFAPKSAWYDYLRYRECTYKKGKKKDNFDVLIADFVKAYADTLKKAASVNEETKKEKAKIYVDGLLDNGGPSTDAFVKQIGKEETGKLYYEVIFGVK